MSARVPRHPAQHWGEVAREAEPGAGSVISFSKMLIFLSVWTCAQACWSPRPLPPWSSPRSQPRWTSTSPAGWTGQNNKLSTLIFSKHIWSTLSFHWILHWHCSFCQTKTKCSFLAVLLTYSDAFLPEGFHKAAVDVVWQAFQKLNMKNVIVAGFPRNAKNWCLYIIILNYIVPYKNYHEPINN